MRTYLKTLLTALGVVLAFAVPARAQISVTSTTISASITSTDAALIPLTSNSGIVAGSFIGVGRELMQVNSIPSGSTTSALVRRGINGTPKSLHLSGSTAYYYATASAFKTQGPNGGAGGYCVLSNTDFDPWIDLSNGRIWRCNAANVWESVIDATYWVPVGSCFYSTGSGTLATPTAVTNIGVYEVKSNGLISSGTSPATPLLQIATTNSGTATNTITCQIPVPSRTNLTRGVYVVDATFTYGVQQTGLGTQVAVLASGTMNAIPVFTKVVFPAAGTAETPSTVTPARWDTGTLVITPVVASSNVATTTVGGFYTIKFTPATPIAMSTDLTNYFVNLTLLCTTTSATSINTAGVLVHYQYVDF